MNSPQDDSLISRAWYDIRVQALHSRATDIHIEFRPQESVAPIRIDDSLYFQSCHPIEFYEHLITQIKILARLDIAEKRLPQDERPFISNDFSKSNIDQKTRATQTRVL